jgi:Uma2 family endonuclease
MIHYNPLAGYPSAEELLESDETPVDNELQDLIPGMLKAILAMVWKNRQDWFFGVDMGLYYDPDLPAVVPDGFLSIGVERVFDEGLRLSYPLWEERVLPMMVMEIVSQTYRSEYKDKKQLYATIGIPYYVVYNPQRKRAAKLEVYELHDDGYTRLENIQTDIPASDRVWLDRVGLAIGRERGVYMGIEREWLYWYQADGTRIVPPEEAYARAEQQLEQSAQNLAQSEAKAAKLAAKLRELGIDPLSI